MIFLIFFKDELYTLGILHLYSLCVLWIIYQKAINSFNIYYKLER
jgi:hypothetical protein